MPKYTLPDGSTMSVLGGEPKGKAKPAVRAPLPVESLTADLAELRALPNPTPDQQAVARLVADVLAKQPTG